MSGEQLNPGIDKEALVSGLGQVALESISLADRQSLLDNLSSVGTKSRNIRNLFPRLSAHGSETFDSPVDFVLALHSDAESFVEDELSGYVSLAQIEQRMPIYIRALLKDEDSQVINAATSIWYALVEQVYGKDASQTHGRPKGVPVPQLKQDGNYLNLPRKKKKQFKKGMTQQELSARQLRRQI